MAECKECRGPFERKRPNQLFCSSACRFRNWDTRHPRVPTAKSRSRVPLARLPHWPELADVVRNAKPHVDVRAMAGVYFLIQSGKVIYVGKSFNVFSRLANHLNQSHKKEFDRVGLVELERSELDAAEVYYIRTADPECNREHRPLAPKVCAWCKNEFVPDWGARQYCSRFCQNSASAERLRARLQLPMNDDME